MLAPEAKAFAETGCEGAPRPGKMPWVVVLVLVLAVVGVEAGVGVVEVGDANVSIWGFSSSFSGFASSFWAPLFSLATTSDSSSYTVRGRAYMNKNNI